MNYIDLFAGAGGLSEGFIREGFNPIAHVEIDRAACNTLKTRMAYHWLKESDGLEYYESYISGKVSRDTFYDLIPKKVLDTIINCEINNENFDYICNKIDILKGNHNIDLIIGGPPCQAYSLIGRNRDSNGMKGDKRNYLFRFYARFLKKYLPRYFVFENVIGLLSAKDKNGLSYFDEMRALFKEAGYETEYQVLSANDYGIPQKRKRIILIGKFGLDKGFYPNFEIKKHKNTIEELLSDLPKIQSNSGSFFSKIAPKKRNKDLLIKLGISDNENYITHHSSRSHNQRDLEIYRIAVDKWNNMEKGIDYNELPDYLKTHNNRSSFTDRFKVVPGNRDSTHTVVAHIAKDGHHYIHFDIEQNRSLTPREVARLQTFPDSYFFESISEKPARGSAYKQIGNAVPVLLGQRIAEKVKDFFNE